MPVEASRADVCHRTAAALRAANPSQLKAVIGFDGFVDNLMTAVNTRHSATDFDPIRTIAAFGNRIAASAGHSSNIELVLKQQKLGGNGPIFANALATLGLSTTYLGNLGYPDVHPIFADFAKRATVHSIANPAVTDAVEFDDGKLMLNKNESLADVSWGNLISRIGLDLLIHSFETSTLIGLANWTMVPHQSDIWRKLLAEVMPRLSAGRKRLVFVDLADPAKRTEADILDALNLLSQFQQYADVHLGLNANEGRRVAELLKLGQFESNRSMVAAIREKMGIAGIVVHTRQGAAGVTADDVQVMAGPFVSRPKVTTGAGDHFNSGYCLGLSLGLGVAERICCGVAVGGYYVSRSQSPSLKELADFIEHLPEPEAGTGH